VYYILHTDIMARKLRETDFGKSAIKVGAGVAGTLVLGALIHGGNSGPNSFSQSVRDEAASVVQGDHADLIGLAPETLSHHAGRFLIQQAIRTGVGFAQSDTQETFADIACDAASASGDHLKRRLVDELGRANSTELSGEQTLTAATLAYNGCVSVLVRNEAQNAPVMPTGVPTAVPLT
jgi:hypothetical protein